MNWRNLTSAELADLPETRLRGALFWMFLGALTAFLVPAIGVTLTTLAPRFPALRTSVPPYLLNWLDRPTELGIIYMAPVAFLMAWSLVFVIMTLGRLRSTPTVASFGIVLWALLRVVVAYVYQASAGAAATGIPLGEGLVRDWPFAVTVLGEIVLAAAFCGYMASGRRPNIYYRRRVARA